MLSLVIACVSLVVISPAPLNPERALEAIVQVENWIPGTIGAAGERGRYQITPAVWRKHSRVPQAKASAAEQLRVARAHLADIRTQLRAARFPDTPYFIGLAWTAGVAKTIARQASPAKRDYAARVENIYPYIK